MQSEKGQKLLRWIIAFIFPLIYLHAYLLISAGVGFLFGITTSGRFSGFSMSLVPYLVYVLVILMFFIKYWIEIKGILKTYRKQILLFSFFWLFMYLIYYAGLFFIPRQGWLDDGIYKYDQENWWYLNRRSPIFPFELMGQGLKDKNILGYPDGYFFLWPINVDKNTWVNLVSYGSIVNAVLFSFLHALLFTVIYVKRLANKHYLEKIFMGAFTLLLIVGGTLVFRDYRNKLTQIPNNEGLKEYSPSAIPNMISTFGQVTYENTKYGLQITFPSDIQSYVKAEYEWPSHEKAYNGLVSVAIATTKTQFTSSGNYYLSYDNPAYYGDILNIEIYDISLCNDKKTDDSEKIFCEKFVFNTETSGVSDYDSNQGYWVRGKRFLFFFLESPEYYTNIRAYNKSPDPIIFNSYSQISKKFKIIILD